MEPDDALRKGLSELPGRKIVYTNGSENHAKRVLAARQLTHQFDAVYGVEHADFQPKPTRAAFDKVFGRDGLNPSKAAMFEDEARNLAVPFALGMRTIHVHADEGDHEHVHHSTHELAEFLSQLSR